MLAELRTAVADLLTREATVPVWPDVPDDIAELPCIVVGYPSASPSSEPIVFDVSLAVYVLGRRQTPGEPQDELVKLTDDTWRVLGGTRVRRIDGQNGPTHFLDVTAVNAAAVTVAGLNIPAYTITVAAPAATC